MNEKSVESTDPRSPDLSALCVELRAEFPHLSRPRQPGEPLGGLFHPLEIARLPAQTREMVGALGLSFYRLLREFGPQTRLAPADALEALRAELAYLLYELERSLGGEAAASGSAEDQAYRLCMRTTRRLAVLARQFEAERLEACGDV